MKIALVVPAGVSNRPTHAIPALMWLVGRLAARHTVKVYALHGATKPMRESVLGADVSVDGGALRHLRTILAISAEHRREPFDLVQSIWAGTVGLVGALAARRIGRPHLVHIAGGELATLRDIGYGGGLSARQRCVNRWVFGRAAVVSAASAPIIAAAREYGARAVRIPLGVDRAAFPPREPVARDTSRPVRLVHVASLNLVKDQGTLLRALAKVVAVGRDVELDVAGIDGMDGQIHEQAQVLGVASRVRFHGWVDSARVRELLSHADIHVVSSLHEAGPVAMLEAAMLGVPTVGTQVGHVREWAPEAALAGPTGDAAALAANIIRLIDDESERNALAAEAKRRALGEDADCTVRLFESQYRAAIGSSVKLPVVSSEFLFRSLARRLGAELICDVGAFDCFHSRRFRATGAKVIAFEANPVNFEALAHDASLTAAGIELFNCAAWNRDESITFNVVDAGPGNGQWRSMISSIRERAPDMHFASRPVSVRAVRLDTFLADEVAAGVRTIALWIDVEGAAYEVLEGIGGIRDRVCLVHVEVETRAFWQGQRLWPDVRALMKNLGFTPVARRPGDEQFDVLFVNDRWLERSRAVVNGITSLAWARLRTGRMHNKLRSLLRAHA